jgi:predicted secreted protein
VAGYMAQNATTVPLAVAQLRAARPTDALFLLGTELDLARAQQLVRQV